MLRTFALALVVIVTASISQAQDQRVAQLVVSARGQVETRPDMATLTLGVETQSRRASAALDENSKAMAKLLALLAGAGIAGRDVQTTGLNLNPQYTRNSGSVQQIIGYAVRNQVSIRVRDLDGLGALLDTIVSGGTNRFQGLSFGLQEPKPYQDRALKNAIAAARAKAAIMAQAAGVTLGGLIDIREAGGNVRPTPILRDMAIAMEAVPIAEGSVGITASVTLTYALAN